MVAQARGQCCCQRALAGGAGTIDANDGDGCDAGLHHRKQRFKVVGKGLGNAFRLCYAYRQIGRVEGSQCKAHRHAVIVISVDAGRLPVCGRRGSGDTDEIRTFLHAGAEFAQLASHGRQAVGFLDTPTRDVAQSRCALCVQGHDGQCHGRIRDVIAVQVDRLERPLAA